VKCRRHYGHTLSKPYDPVKHFNFDGNKRKLWKDKFTGDQALDGFMVWEIGKVWSSSLLFSCGVFFLLTGSMFLTLQGATIDSDTETNTSFGMHVPEMFVKGIKHTHDLYSCSLDEAPETIDNDRELPPIFTDMDW
jgi:hypothetical protein